MRPYDVERNETFCEETHFPCEITVSLDAFGRHTFQTRAPIGEFVEFTNSVVYSTKWSKTTQKTPFKQSSKMVLMEVMCVDAIGGQQVMRINVTRYVYFANIVMGHSAKANKEPLTICHSSFRRCRHCR